MVSKILVPLDGSKVSRKAAKYAVDLTKQTGASLTLLSVIDNRFVVGQVVSASASPNHLKEPVEDYLKQSAQSFTDEIAKVCERNRIQYKAVIRTGHHVEEIVNEATRSKSDLIVIGEADGFKINPRPNVLPGSLVFPFLATVNTSFRI